MQQCDKMKTADTIWEKAAYRVESWAQGSVVFFHHGANTVLWYKHRHRMSYVVSVEFCSIFKDYENQAIEASDDVMMDNCLVAVQATKCIAIQQQQRRRRQ